MQEIGSNVLKMIDYTPKYIIINWVHFMDEKPRKRVLNNQNHPRTKRWASIPPTTFVYFDETLSESLPGNDLIEFAQEMFLGNYLIVYVIAIDRPLQGRYNNGYCNN